MAESKLQARGWSQKNRRRRVSGPEGMERQWGATRSLSKCTPAAPKLLQVPVSNFGWEGPEAKEQAQKNLRFGAGPNRIILSGQGSGGQAVSVLAERKASKFKTFTMEEMLSASPKDNFGISEGLCTRRDPPWIKEEILGALGKNPSLLAAFLAAMIEQEHVIRFLALKRAKS